MELKPIDAQQLDENHDGDNDELTSEDDDDDDCNEDVKKKRTWGKFSRSEDRGNKTVEHPQLSRKKNIKKKSKYNHLSKTIRRQPKRNRTNPAVRTTENSDAYQERY